MCKILDGHHQDQRNRHCKTVLGARSNSGKNGSCIEKSKGTERRLGMASLTGSYHAPDRVSHGVRVHGETTQLHAWCYRPVDRYSRQHPSAGGSRLQPDYLLQTSGSRTGDDSARAGGHNRSAAGGWYRYDPVDAATHKDWHPQWLRAATSSSESPRVRQIQNRLRIVHRPIVWGNLPALYRRESVASSRVADDCTDGHPPRDCSAQSLAVKNMQNHCVTGHVRWRGPPVVYYRGRFICKLEYVLLVSRKICPHRRYIAMLQVNTS